MTTFTTRIQLHNADGNDFKKLVAEMKKEAFVSNKASVVETKAEFSYKGTQLIKDVIAAVLRAAVKTGKQFSFTVMKDKQYEKQEKGRRRLAL